MADAEMTAIVCRAPKDYRVERVQRPSAARNELVIRIAACGICASDCKCWSGAKMFWGGPNPWVKAPVIPGHEFFGYVEELGEGAEEHFGVKKGDRVIAEQIVPCAKCRYCKSGEYWMCEVHNIFGFQREVADGGMAEYMRFPPTAIVHKIPDGISLEDAAIIEPLACAHLKTPKKLVVIDLVDERLALAREYGADITINPKTDDALETIRSITDRYGCDVYIETTGVPAGVSQGLELIRKLGRFVEFSVFGADTTVDWSIIGDRKELDVRGAHLGPYCYPIAIDLLARGLVTSKGIVTHGFTLDEWDEAIKIANSLDSIKVLLKPK
jgi:L-iditol 2-dehydrogenase